MDNLFTTFVSLLMMPQWPFRMSSGESSPSSLVAIFYVMLYYDVTCSSGSLWFKCAFFLFICKAGKYSVDSYSSLTWIIGQKSIYLIL